REPELPDQLPRVGVVVALVQAHPLGVLGRGGGALHWDAIDRRLDELLVVAVWPPDPPPPPPPLAPPPPAPPVPPPARRGGVLARRLATQRSLGHRPVHRQPGPIDLLEGVVLGQPELPEPGEHSGVDPLLEAAVGRTAGADAGGIQGVPLAAGAEHEEDGVHGLAVIDARVMAAQRVGP